MWQIAVFDSRQHDQYRSVRARFALVRGQADDRWTFVADDPPADGASVRMRVEADHVRLECHGLNGHIELPDGAAFWAGKVIQLQLPALFQLADTWFEVRDVEASAVAGLEPLHRPVEKKRAPGGGPGPDADTVARWLGAVGELHRTAASAPEFYVTAARLTLESTGLDAAIVLVRRDDQWEIAGSAVPQPQFGIGYDSAAVAHMYDRPEVWRCPARPSVAANAAEAPSQQSIVVAPVFGPEREVIAAVYGVRHGRGDNRRRGIRPLEARVVELMADAVGSGMARRAHEVEAARQQILLEQAFSPAVVEHLRKHPEALAGCTREATLLFADLRGFTALAEHLSPADAYELLGEVMEWLTQAVMEHGGMIVDYYGDGLCALWNAPLESPEHADLACAAAMHMLDALPALSDRWRSRLGQALELGVGLHTGEVQMGNAGTRRRLKYGPRGSAVNIASRVQAATKHLDVPLLVTDAVRRRLSSRFVTLRACTAKLPGLEQPVELFTAFPATDGARLQDDLSNYADALAAFEGGDLDEAERVLSALLADGPATPAAFLAQQAAALRNSALGRRASDQFGVRDDAVIEILMK
jgi:adenylate cyclase